MATTKLTLCIPDASCIWCARRIEPLLADVLGVIKVTIKPKRRAVQVLYVPDLTNAAQLVAVVREAGFSVQPKANAGAGVVGWLRRLRIDNTPTPN